MKTNLKDNIWIEGFDLIEELQNTEGYKNLIPVIFVGKTSEIPEEIAKECIEYFIQRCKYRNYNPDKLIDGIKLMGFNYSKQSIQSACDKPYCIIYKSK